MAEPGDTDDQVSSGTVAKVLDWTSSLVDKNDPEFKPLVTVMIIAGLIFGGMLFYGFQAHMFSANDTSGKPLTGSSVYFISLLVVLGILGVACLATIARSFFLPSRAASTLTEQQPARLADDERNLLIYCKLAEQGLATGTKKRYISRPFKLDHDEVITTFDRLSRAGKK